MPAPPYSSSTVIPNRPRSPNLGHRSRGNSLSRSMRAARGAIASAAKSATVARRISSVSPSSKSSPEYINVYVNVKALCLTNLCSCLLAATVLIVLEDVAALPGEEIDLVQHDFYVLPL